MKKIRKKRKKNVVNYLIIIFSNIIQFNIHIIKLKF